mmetsp:Transcript_50925/g.163728  ORF Transcript_50925/g.163728 Transcript_50925/m.163728 type:complete len:332 (-) Transcript_50925:68-1063(-)
MSLSVRSRSLSRGVLWDCDGDEREDSVCESRGAGLGADDAVDSRRLSPCTRLAPSFRWMASLAACRSLLLRRTGSSLEMQPPMLVAPGTARVRVCYPPLPVPVRRRRLFAARSAAAQSPAPVSPLADHADTTAPGDVKHAGGGGARHRIGASEQAHSLPDGRRHPRGNGALLLEAVASAAATAAAADRRPAWVRPPAAAGQAQPGDAPRGDPTGRDDRGSARGRRGSARGHRAQPRVPPGPRGGPRGPGLQPNLQRLPASARGRGNPSGARLREAPPHPPSRGPRAGGHDHPCRRHRERRQPGRAAARRLRDGRRHGVAQCHATVIHTAPP